MNRQALKQLADYLWAGSLQAKFNMFWYDDETTRDRIGRGSSDCGTVGCAAGHGPYAGIPKLLDETWDKYTLRVFGISSALYLDNYLWRFIFSGSWSSIDNTPQGAAKRIYYVLEHGVPECIQAMLNGDIPLCYLNQGPVET